MPATLTASGINFNDGTVGNSRANFFAPAGTVCLFFRSTAPTGWSQITTQNDKMLRIVSVGSGGNTGGVNTFSGTFTSRGASATVPVTISGLSVNPSTLDVNSVPLHAHPVNLGGNTGSSSASPSLGSVTLATPGSSTGNYGNSGAHNHPAFFSSASGPWSSSIDMRLQYIDIIICSFNG